MPKELIASVPIKPRDHSRLMVIEKETGLVKNQRFFNILEFLNSEDLLVLNDSKVFPARLLGRKAQTGGKVEILLNKEVELGVWEAVCRNVKKGDIIIFSQDLSAEVMKKYDEICVVRFNLFGLRFFNHIEKIGHTPIPYYIKRGDNKSDVKNYQTVYAKNTGSIAAPTAGLHFTNDLLAEIKKRKIEITNITLNVGLGTFFPVKKEKIEEHKMHSEFYSVNKITVEKIINAKNKGRRIIAVGTTTTRVLEHLLSVENLKVDNYSGWTNIYIYPGYEFKCIDGLITNFHLPKSTLLMLVSAFAGKDKIKSAYKEAIKRKYRFYSYGDAMLII